jgi:N-acetylglutamate synthase-like GNAT family acetyltransferase
VEEIKIREVVAKDAEQIVFLLEELGYPNTLTLVQKKITTLAKSNSDTILVAEADGKVIGVAHLHIAELFHQKGCLGRAMALVVANDCVGEKLMASLETMPRKSGCVKMEVTSGTLRSGAHVFYKRLGYREKRRRFIKEL